MWGFWTGFLPLEEQGTSHWKKNPNQTQNRYFMSNSRLKKPDDDYYQLKEISLLFDSS